MQRSRRLVRIHALCEDTLLCRLEHQELLLRAEAERCAALHEELRSCRRTAEKASAEETSLREGLNQTIQSLQAEQLKTKQLVTDAELQFEQLQRDCDEIKMARRNADAHSNRLQAELHAEMVKRVHAEAELDRMKVEHLQEQAKLSAMYEKSARELSSKLVKTVDELEWTRAEVYRTQRAAHAFEIERNLFRMRWEESVLAHAEVCADLVRSHMSYACMHCIAS